MKFRLYFFYFLCYSHAKLKRDIPKYNRGILISLTPNHAKKINKLVLIALLRYEVQSGCKSLENRLRTAGSCRKCRQQDLIDETSDVTTIEQVFFCLRYFDHANEEWRSGVLCLSLTSTVAQNISEVISKIMKDPGYFRGQGYDGAQIMSDEIKGMQARIAKDQQLYSSIGLASKAWQIMSNQF